MSRSVVAAAFGLFLAQAIATGGSLAASEPKAAPLPPARRSNSTDEQRTESLRGKVVWLSEALKRLDGVDSDADVAHACCALETSDGRVLPIVKDARGRGFWLDERIRNIDVELLVRPLSATRMIQVIRVYTVKKNSKYELDYWCDVCSIPMFELKACECCQGPTQLRERPVDQAEKD